MPVPADSMLLDVLHAYRVSASLNAPEKPHFCLYLGQQGFV
jgi:hypothetical protein